MGLLQLMPATAKALVKRSQPMEPIEATRGAAELLGHLWQKYRGNLAKALRLMTRDETKADSGRVLPRETRNYVARGA